MSVTDYVLDIALIAIIFRQMRERELTGRAIVLPLVLIVLAGQRYLHGFPDRGNDLFLMAILIVVGAILGTASGLATRVRPIDGVVVARAGVAAAVSWVLGMGSRFAFAIWVNTAAGAVAISHFSAHHDITSAQAWTTALVLMAFAEVVARVVVLQLRRWRAASVTTAPNQTFA
jgi:hypothetical protein